MKHLKRYCLALWLIPALGIVSTGCVPMGPGLVDGLTVTPPVLGSGFYWVEYDEPELALFEMPRDRDDAGGVGDVRDGSAGVVYGAVALLTGRRWHLAA